MEAEVRILLALEFISVSHQKAFLPTGQLCPSAFSSSSSSSSPSGFHLLLISLTSFCKLAFLICPCILALFSNILPLVIWPTFYLRILPSSVSGSLKSSRFSQVCLVILLFPSHWDELCVFTPFILFLYENRSPFLEFIIK